MRYLEKLVIDVKNSFWSVYFFVVYLFGVRQTLH